MRRQQDLCRCMALSASNSNWEAKKSLWEASGGGSHASRCILTIHVKMQTQKKGGKNGSYFFGTGTIRTMDARSRCAGVGGGNTPRPRGFIHPERVTEGSCGWSCSRRFRLVASYRSISCSLLCMIRFRMPSSFRIQATAHLIGSSPKYHMAAHTHATITYALRRQPHTPLSACHTSSLWAAR
jgi:hypothetical protein